MNIDSLTHLIPFDKPWGWSAKRSHIFSEYMSQALKKMKNNTFYTKSQMKDMFVDLSDEDVENMLNCMSEENLIKNRYVEFLEDNLYELTAKGFECSLIFKNCLVYALLFLINENPGISFDEINERYYYFPELRDDLKELHEIYGFIEVKFNRKFGDYYTPTVIDASAIKLTKAGYYLFQNKGKITLY